MRSPHSKPAAVKPPVDRLETIQILRGVAAMLVVYNHAGLLLIQATERLGQSLLVPTEAFATFGSIGVDLFFVTSGFVMAMSARGFDGQRDGARFLALRFVRIAPLFYIFCLLWLTQLLPAGVPVSPGTMSNSLLFLPLIDQTEYSWPIHYLGWTLSFEFMFYLIVSGLIASGQSRNATMLLLAMLALPLLSYPFSDGLVLWHMFTNPIQWEFAMGVGLFLLWQAQLLRRIRMATLAGLLFSVVLLAGMLLQGEAIFLAKDTVNGTTSAARALYWGVPMALLLCLLLGSEPLTSGRPRRLLTAVGDASYSIYLSHLFVVRAAKEVVERDWLPFGPGQGADLLLGVVLVLSAIVGFGVHRLMERPLLSWGRLRVKLFFLRRPDNSLEGSPGNASKHPH